MKTFRIIAIKYTTVLVEDVEAETAAQASALVQTAFDEGENYADRWVVNEESDKTATLSVQDVEEVQS